MPARTVRSCCPGSDGNSPPGKPPRFRQALRKLLLNGAPALSVRAEVRTHVAVSLRPLLPARSSASSSCRNPHAARVTLKSSHAQSCAEAGRSGTGARPSPGILTYLGPGPFRSKSMPLWCAANPGRLKASVPVLRHCGVIAQMDFKDRSRRVGSRDVSGNEYRPGPKPHGHWRASFVLHIGDGKVPPIVDALAFPPLSKPSRVPAAGLDRFRHHRPWSRRWSGPRSFPQRQFQGKASSAGRPRRQIIEDRAVAKCSGGFQVEVACGDSSQWHARDRPRLSPVDDSRDRLGVSCGSEFLPLGRRQVCRVKSSGLCRWCSAGKHGAPQQQASYKGSGLRLPFLIHIQPPRQ